MSTLAGESSVAAVYYDGRSARRHLVSLSLGDGHIVLQSEGLYRQEPLSTIEVSERIAAAARVVRFKDGAYCQIQDHAAFEAVLAAAGYRAGWVERGQRKLGIAVAACLALVGIAVLTYLRIWPFLSDRLAARVPNAAVTELSTHTLAALDESAFDASALDAERRAGLVQGFAKLTLPGAPAVRRIEFRSAPDLGPNAFALPDGTVVVLDKLVLQSSDDEIYAVLAHEEGHVHYRHGLRAIIRGTGVALVVSAWFGDVSTLLAALPTAVLEAKYSRQFEAQADDYAAAALSDNGKSPGLLADALEHLSAQDPKPERASYLSSHPASAERIRHLRELAGAR